MVLPMSASDSVPVTVQGLGEIPLVAGKPLLHALRDAGIFISSACGGRGACGMCRLTVPGGAWKGETGLITEVVVRSIADGADIEAYLCGSPPMINACLKVLRTKKIPEDRIHCDRFL